jgi:hypothetical protein
MAPAAPYGRSQCGIDDAQEWNQQVVQDHGPARKKSYVRVERLRGKGVGRARRGKRTSHLPIAKGGKQHCHHSDQVAKDHVSEGRLLHNAEDRVRGSGCEDYQPIEDQITTRENATKCLRTG